MFPQSLEVDPERCDSLLALCALVDPCRLDGYLFGGGVVAGRFDAELGRLVTLAEDGDGARSQRPDDGGHVAERLGRAGHPSGWLAVPTVRGEIT